MTIAENLQAARDSHDSAEVARNRVVAQRKAGEKDAAEQSAKECYLASCDCQSAFDRILYGPASPDKDDAVRTAQRLRRQCAGYIAEADGQGYY